MLLASVILLLISMEIVTAGTSRKLRTVHADIAGHACHT